MRSGLLLLGTLGVHLWLASVAVAQEASLFWPAPATPAAWEAAWPQSLSAQALPTSEPIELDIPIERNPRLDIDFLLGLPIAARVGWAVFRHKEQAVLVEAMGGVDYVIPFVAAGARYRFVAWHTERGELVIKPGVDAYLGGAPFVIGALPVFGVGGDVACVFLHNGPHHGFEWGVDLGAIGLMGAGRGAVPLASFILGFNF